MDSDITTFVNHGCKGTYNVGVKTDVDEFSADKDHFVESLTGKRHTGTTIYNPAVDRSLLFDVDCSIRDIHAGEELLTNYLDFVGSGKDWAEDVQDLRDTCSGKVTLGSITEYEQYSDEED